MRCLIFGSSHRRGSTGWTDGQRILYLLTIARPDVVIEGESPAGGADRLARIGAESLGIHVDPCPHDPRVDGPAPGGLFARNARMRREKRPHVGACFGSGKVGEPLSSGSADMLAICERGLWKGRGKAKELVAPPIPVVVYREDGIDMPRATDPDCPGDPMAGDLWYARRTLRGLVRFAREDVIEAGLAVAAAHDRVRARMPTSAVRPYVAAAWNAVETLRARQGRLGPWLDVVEGVVKRNVAR